MKFDDYITSMSFVEHKKSEGSLYSEYEQDKWRSFAAYLNEHAKPTVSDDYLRAVENWTLSAYDPDAEHLVCLDNELLYVPVPDLISRNYDLILHGLKYVYQKYEFKRIVELGSGLGNNLIVASKDFPDVIIESRELSQTARNLQEVFLTKDIKKLDLDTFNLFSQENTFSFEGAVVFTSYVFSLVKCFPKNIIDTLIQSGAKYVVNVEPIYEIQDENCNLGSKIREYISANDYNLDYYEKLLDYEASGKVRILTVERNKYGINPFFPATLLIWEICNEN